MEDITGILPENNIFTSFLSIAATLKKRKKYKKEEYLDRVFISEDESSEYEEIKPYNMFPEIMQNFLEIEDDYLPEELRGRLHTINYKLDISLQHRLSNPIIKFVNKYGLLGLYAGDRSRKYLKHDMKLENVMYIPPITMFNKLKDDSFFKNYEEILSSDTIKKGKKVVKIWGMDGNSYYESIDGFMFELDNIYRHRKNIERFKNIDNNGKKLTEDDIFIPVFDEPIEKGTTWKDYFDGVMNEYTGHNLYSMSLEYENGSFKLKHDCKTLLSSIILMSFQDIVNQYQKIRFCDNPKCGRAYTVKSKKQKFHNESCATYVRVNRLRGRDIDANGY